jgi:IS5 family transposase
MSRRSALRPDLFAGQRRESKLDRLGDPLVALDRHIDFGELAAEVDRVAPRPVSPQGGRPPYPTETMVRILVVKRLHNLSDEQVEFQLNDRLSFQRFCGLQHSATIPDRTTVWTFENRIGPDAAKALFEAVQVQLQQRGYLARCGQIIDATLVSAPRQHLDKEDKAALENGEDPDWTPAQACQRDTDASWTKKHGKSHFGYKLSANVDAKHKLIRKIETGTASEHDSQHFEALIDTGNTSGVVYADRGYPSAEREAALKARGMKPMIQRKAQRNRPLSQRQKQRNRRIATVRARVEHVFGAIAQMGGKLLRTIGQTRADFAMTMMAVCYNLKRLTHLESVRSAAS